MCSDGNSPFIKLRRKLMSEGRSSYFFFFFFMGGSSVRREPSAPSAQQTLTFLYKAYFFPTWYLLIVDRSESDTMAGAASQPGERLCARSPIHIIIPSRPLPGHGSVTPLPEDFQHSRSLSLCLPSPPHACRCHMPAASVSPTSPWRQT